MVGTKEVSESRGSFDGPPVDPGYLARFAQAHEAAGFDRVLIGYHATGPDGFAVAAHVLNATTRLKVLIAHRPGFVAPTLVARKLATLDQLTGGGRVAIHHITGGDELDQKRDGDFADHDRRYARTAEFMGLLRRELTATEPFDHDGEFYRVRGAYSYVKRPRRMPSRCTSAERHRPPSAWAPSTRTCTCCGASRSPRSPSGSPGSARKRAATAGRSGSACRSGRSWARPRKRRGSAPRRSARPPSSGSRGRVEGRPAAPRAREPGAGRPGSGHPGARAPPVRLPRILLGRLGAAPAAGGRARGVRRPALVRGDPADRARAVTPRRWSAPRARSPRR